jgi:hypothetical protein
MTVARASNWQRGPFSLIARPEAVRPGGTHRLPSDERGEVQRVIPLTGKSL